MEEIKVLPCFSCLRGKHNAQACFENEDDLEKVKGISPWKGTFEVFKLFKGAARLCQNRAGKLNGLCSTK